MSYSTSHASHMARAGRWVHVASILSGVFKRVFSLTMMGRHAALIAIGIALTSRRCPIRLVEKHQRPLINQLIETRTIPCPEGQRVPAAQNGLRPTFGRLPFNIAHRPAGFIGNTPSTCPTKKSCAKPSVSLRSLRVSNVNLKKSCHSSKAVSSSNARE
jgi:hypothetical protein